VQDVRTKNKIFQDQGHINSNRGLQLPVLVLQNNRGVRIKWVSAQAPVRTTFSPLSDNVHHIAQNKNDIFVALI